MDTNVHGSPQNTQMKWKALQTSAMMLMILIGHDMMDC